MIINKEALKKIFLKGFAFAAIGVVVLTPMGCASARELPEQFQKLGLEQDGNSRLGTIGKEKRKDNWISKERVQRI